MSVDESSSSTDKPDPDAVNSKPDEEMWAGPRGAFRGPPPVIDRRTNRPVGASGAVGSSIPEGPVKYGTVVTAWCITQVFNFILFTFLSSHAAKIYSTGKRTKDFADDVFDISEVLMSVLGLLSVTTAGLMFASKETATGGQQRAAKFSCLLWVVVHAFTYVTEKETRTRLGLEDSGTLFWAVVYFGFCYGFTMADRSDGDISVEQQPSISTPYAFAAAAYAIAGALCLGQSSTVVKQFFSGGSIADGSDACLMANTLIKICGLYMIQIGAQFYTLGTTATKSQNWLCSASFVIWLIFFTINEVAETTSEAAGVSKSGNKALLGTSLAMAYWFGKAEGSVAFRAKTD